MRHFKRMWACSSAMLIAGMSSGALAQADAAEEMADPGLGDIIVTAERRSSSIQKTPLSIVAMTGDALKEAGVESTLDLQLIAPGVAVSTNTATAQIYVRGVGTNFGGDQSVAVHVDGVYQVTTQAALQEFLGVDRVEVLKGPQGTLYGRNATAGVVNIITQRPTMDLEFEGDLEIGNFDRLRERLLVNVPIVSDKVALRATFLNADRDGFRRNPYLNTRIDDENYWAGRAQLLLAPNENLELLLIGNYSHEKDSRTLGFKINKNVFAPQVDLLPSFGLAPGTVPDDPMVIYSDKRSQQNFKQYGGSAHLTWRLGGVNLRSLTAYQENRAEEDIDIDGTEIPYFNGFTDGGKVSWFSQELQLASEGNGPLQWVAGLFYLRDRRRERGVYTTPLFDALGLSNGPIGRDFDQRSEAYAAFGQATYALDEHVRITAGARFGRERKSATQYVNADAALGVDERGRKTWNSFTPRLAVEYSPNKDVMLYASVIKGFKSGGFNESARDVFDPETIWSYEAGLRSTWLDGKLRFNASAFFYDYTNIQVNQALPAPDPETGATTEVGNAASAEVKGLEFELSALPLEGLRLSAGVSLLDAKYKSFLSPNSEVDATIIVDLSGNRLPRAPKFAATLSAQYTHEIRAAGSVYVQGDFYHQSRVFFTGFNNLNDRYGQQSSYEIVNGRIGFDTTDKRWSIALFGRNLTNRVYKQNVIRALGFFGQLDLLAPPRTYGVQLGFKF
ncbi:MAG: TonB-dependent receptor [Sphingobium sp.]